MLKTKLELKNKISFKGSKGLPTLAMRLWLLESWWHYNWKQQTKDIISFGTEMANGDGTNWTRRSHYHNAWQTNIRGGLSHIGIIFGTDLAYEEQRNGTNRSPVRYPKVPSLPIPTPRDR